MQVRSSLSVKNPIFTHFTDLENNKFPKKFSFLSFSCSGDYVCQISDKVTKDQVHTVEILGEFIKEMRTGK